MSEWFCQQKGIVSGPFSGTHLREKATSGNIQPDTLVRKGETGDWTTADHVRGLFPAAHGMQNPPKELPKSTPSAPPHHALSDEELLDAVEGESSSARPSSTRTPAVVAVDADIGSGRHSLGSEDLAEWYVQANGQEHGPYSATTLRQYAAEGRVIRTTLVKKGKEGPWVEAQQGKGLFASSESPPMATPVAQENPSSFFEAECNTHRPLIATTIGEGLVQAVERESSSTNPSSTETPAVDADSGPEPDPFSETFSLMADSPTERGHRSHAGLRSKKRGPRELLASVAEDLNRKRYPALVILAAIYRVGGFLGILEIALMILLALLIAIMKLCGSRMPDIDLQVGIFFVCFLIFMAFQTIICFSIAEIIKWAIDMKAGNWTTNSLLQELLKKLDR